MRSDIRTKLLGAIWDEEWPCSTILRCRLRPHLWLAVEELSFRSQLSITDIVIGALIARARNEEVYPLLDSKAAKRRKVHRLQYRQEAKRDGQTLDHCGIALGDIGGSALYDEERPVWHCPRGAS